MALVVGRTTLVGLGVALLGRGLRRGGEVLLGGALAGQRLLGVRGAEVGGADGGQADAALGTVSPSSTTYVPAAATAQSPARRSTFS